MSTAVAGIVVPILLALLVATWRASSMLAVLAQKVEQISVRVDTMHEDVQSVQREHTARLQAVETKIAVVEARAFG